MAPSNKFPVSSLPVAPQGVPPSPSGGAKMRHVGRALVRSGVLNVTRGDIVDASLNVLKSDALTPGAKGSVSRAYALIARMQDLIHLCLDPAASERVRAAARRQLDSVYEYSSGAGSRTSRAIIVDIIVSEATAKAADAASGAERAFNRISVTYPELASRVTRESLQLAIDAARRSNGGRGKSKWRVIGSLADEIVGVRLSPLATKNAWLAYRRTQSAGKRGIGAVAAAV